MTLPVSVRAAIGLALCLAALGLDACGRPAGKPPKAAAEKADAASNGGYLAPPQFNLAERGPDGVVRLTGTAAADAKVSLASPDGTAFTAMAGADGVWSLSLPPATAPRMFAVSADAGGETVRAEGALLVLPAPGPPGLLARAGSAAQVLGAAPKAARVVALDYDGEGGAAVAGFAPPGGQIRLSLDGQPAGVDQANAKGRFAVMAPNRRLPAGQRRIEIEVQGAPPASVEAEVSPPQPLSAPYRATRQNGAWRIDWRPPGGGVQTTLVFDSEGTPPA